MKLTITKKISFLVSLPIITIVLFSLNHIYEKSILLEEYRQEMHNVTVMQQATNLLHELQIERGLSAGYLNQDAGYEFTGMLQKQRLYTDRTILLFTNAMNGQKELLNLKNKISTLKDIRQGIDSYTLTQEDSFNFFSLINKNIITVFRGSILHSSSKEINSDILTLNRLITFQELAGQERALVAKLLNTSSISNTDKILYHKLIALQDDEYHHIHQLLNTYAKYDEFKNIYDKYNKNFFMVIRNKLTIATLDKGTLKFKFKKLALDRKKWLFISTSRINEINAIEDSLLKKVKLYIEKDIEKNYNALITQVTITILTIVFLLLGTFFITRKIRYSILQLENGLDDFFKFLNDQGKRPLDIQTNSNDEINDMAKRINTQILTTENNLEDDVDFINEITQIVTLMKNGDFSERPYFKPFNPHLKELKEVFNQLTDLISDKIKEQTNSLESLNSSLEDRVHFQTLELEKQIREITIAMEKAVQAEIAKDEFLANMSHEIRTPLNAILGFVTILKKTIQEEEPLRYLSIIDTSGKSLLTIINDILDFSKIQSGKFTITPHPVQTIQTLSDATLLFASKAHEKHQVLAVYIDPSMPQTINVDGVRLIQIFSNILSNAIKFTPEDGSIEINITCVDSLLKISIKDTGIGIAQENIAKVFSAFEQADGSTTRKYGGTGLGLSISHKLAKLMNGDIQLESQEGHGSTFTLKLPVEVINNSPEVFLGSLSPKDLRIAILDNNIKQNKRGLIKRYLIDFGITNIIVLDSFQKNGYDLLFFTPDDEYNEDIVYSDKPAVALLRSSSVKLANLPHLHPLYMPYTPLAVNKAIEDSCLQEINAKKEILAIEKDFQIEFEGRILVAEDNKTNQMLISLLLQDYALDFSIVNDGVEAVNIFKEEKFDLILMDENMPELNGIGAMEQIKAYEAEKSLIATPIIALTASVLETDKEKFINAGMDGFVGKPINTDELESELKRFLKVKE